MAAKSWEKYLFKEHRIVPLSFAENNVELLDVLLKVSNGKFLGSGGPELVRAGSLLILGSGEVEGWAEVRETMKAELESMKNKDSSADDHPQLQILYEGDWNVRLKGSSKLVAGIDHLVKSDLSSSKSFDCEFRNVTCRKVDEDFFMELVWSDEPLWRPNMSKLERILHHPGSTKGDARIELWVITGVKYATRIRTGHSSSRGAGANVAVASAIAPVPLGVRAEASLSNEESVVINASAQSTTGIPLGFKAVRLVYDQEGRLLEAIKDMGRKMPKKRDAQDRYDPDKDPDYHMGALLQIDQADEGDVECLPLLSSGDDDHDDGEMMASDAISSESV